MGFSPLLVLRFPAFLYKAAYTKQISRRAEGYSCILFDKHLFRMLNLVATLKNIKHKSRKLVKQTTHLNTYQTFFYPIICIMIFLSQWELYAYS